MITIGIVVFPGVEELDFVGPWEVFTVSAHLLQGSARVLLVSEHGGEISCVKGLRVIADYSYDNCPALDVVLVPGGRGTRTEVNDERTIAFLRQTGAACSHVTSVCTGSFLLERAGFLAGRRATTHWGSLERLRDLGTVEVIEERLVDEGSVLTAAGVSAGIDLALHLTGRLWGAEHGTAVQHWIEYAPEPPFPLPARE